MKKFIKYFVIAISLSVAAPISHADSEVESLSPKLRALLYKEMLALRQGMQSIFSAHVAGNMEEVVEIATKMKNGYILNQQMTEDQRSELTTKLPQDFLQMDEKFHEYAGLLARVAEENHTELVGFYYLRLTESCVGCHSQYARHRFPAFRQQTAGTEHQH
ncbi:MAG: cytochrome c [Arenicella sp.]|nr:cytochrome c [Arenicella sp.]